MAFQNLKTGNTVYAFTKSNPPTFAVGQVISDAEVHAKYPQPNQVPGYPPAFMPNQEQAVKLSIRFGEKIQPIDNLMPTADIQDCGNGLFLSCSREAINAEVLAFKQLSDSAIAPDVIEMHRSNSIACADIITKLNPEIAERQRLEEENRQLRSELQTIKSETSEVKSMVTSLLKQLGATAEQ